MYTLRELISAGGPILIILAAISVYSVALIFERWFFYKNKISSSAKLLDKVKRHLKSGETDEAADCCKRMSTPAETIIHKAFLAHGTRAEKRDYIGGVIEYHTMIMQKRLSVLATLGSTTPYIGLFGTVLGVMRAFRDLSAYSGAGPSVVAAGIAEALVNTAAGLFVAIPAIFAYNYFISRSNQFAKEMEYMCEEVITACSKTRETGPRPPVAPPVWTAKTN